MDKANPSSIPIVFKSLDMTKDPLRPHEDNEEILGPGIPYLSTIRALLYVANCTQLDISFVVSPLSRFSTLPTQRQWK